MSFRCDVRENRIFGSLIDEYPFSCLRIDFRNKTVLTVHSILSINSGIAFVSLGASLTGQILEEFQHREI